MFFILLPGPGHCASSSIRQPRARTRYVFSFWLRHSTRKKATVASVIREITDAFASGSPGVQKHGAAAFLHSAIVKRLGFGYIECAQP